VASPFRKSAALSEVCRRPWSVRHRKEAKGVRLGRPKTVTKLSTTRYSSGDDGAHDTGHEVVVGIDPKPDKLNGVDLVG
jgi:hypothetical protein